MKTNLRAYLKNAPDYLRLCLHLAWHGSVSSAAAWSSTLGLGLLAAFIFTLKIKVPTDSSLISQIEITISSIFLTWMLIFALRFLIFAPYSIFLDLNKRLDWEDTARLLRGQFIFGDTFIYDAEISLCKRFTGRFEIEEVKSGFNEIFAAAPKNSWATIKIELSNGHPKPEYKYKFYIRDARNCEFAVDDIYQSQDVLLNDRGAFWLTLRCDENFVHEQATLQVSLESWTK